MAKKAKKSSKAKAKPETKKGGPKVGKPTGGTTKLPKASAITSLDKKLTACEKDTRSASESKTGYLNEAVKNDGINAKAFKAARSIGKMKNTQELASFLAHLPYCLEHLGVFARAGMQADAFGHEPKETGEPETPPRPNFSAAGDEHLARQAANGGDIAKH
jgi:hypothetical protein